MKKLISSILAAAMAAAAMPVSASAETTYEITTPEDIEGGAVYMSLGTPDSGIPFINDDGETEYEAAEDTEFFAEGEAASGAEITVYVIADDGYELTSLTVSGDNVSYTIEDGITAVSDDEYSFIMPAEAVNVIPEFEAVNGTELSYDAQTGILTINSDTAYDTAKLIAAEYTDDGTLVGTALENISVPADAPFVRTYTTGNIYNRKFMLWDGLNSMSPLASSWTAESKNAASEGDIAVNTFGTGTSIKPRITVSGEGANGQLAAADVTLDGEALDGTAELRIKYDAGRGLDASTLLPQYFNTETGGWENIPYMIDEDNNEAMILTDHFSSFALFYKGMFNTHMSGSPAANATLNPSAVASMKQQTADAILGNFNEGTTTLTEDTVGEVLDSLDGAFNGKLMTTGGAVATVKTHYTGETAGKLNKSFTKGLGNSFTMVGAVGACISLANTAYKKGVFTTESGVAAVNAVAGIAVNFASWPVQVGYLAYSLAKMGHDHYEAKELKKTNKQIERAFGVYKQSNKKSMEDWKAVFDKCYEKYYTNGTKGTPTENFARFDSALRKTIAGYAYQFYSYYSGASDKRLHFSRLPKPDDTTREIASDLCANYEAELMQSLTSMFLSYSRKAYNEGIKRFDEDCKELNDTLNGFITLNFTESENNRIPMPEDGVYLQFPGTKLRPDDMWDQDYFAGWCVEYPEKAILKFTLLSYIQIGCPDRITVYADEDMTEVLGYVLLPNGLEPDKSFDVPLVIVNSGTKRIHLHEVKEDSSDDYVFAGLSGKLVGINDNANEKDYSFTLDDKGEAYITIDFEKYTSDGAPDTIELSDADGNVIYQTSFNAAATDIPLGGDVYTVSISCNDDGVKESYKNTIAKVEYIAGYDAEPVTIASAKLNKNGKALIVFDRSKYEFFNKNLMLNLYAADGENIIDFWELQDAFNDGKIKKIVLGSGQSYEEEKLRIKESSVTIVGTGGQEKITVLSGEIGFTSSSNPKVATAEGEYINAHSAGAATITFEDMWGNKEYVRVTVVDNNPFIDGIYRVTLISEYESLNDTEKTWEPGGGSYDFIQMYVDAGEVETVYTQTKDGWTEFFSHDPESLKFAKIKDGAYNTDDYLEEVTVNSFKRHVITYYDINSIDLHWTVHQVYLYERTNFDSFPPAGTTGLG